MVDSKKQQDGALLPAGADQTTAKTDAQKLARALQNEAGEDQLFDEDGINTLTEFITSTFAFLEYLEVI